MNYKQGGSPKSRTLQPALHKRRLFRFSILGSFVLVVLLILAGPRLMKHIANSVRDPAPTAIPTVSAPPGGYDLAQLQPSGPIPPARSGAMAMWTGRDLLLFGGYEANQHCCFGDLFAYDPRRNVWQPRAHGPGRAGGAFVWDGSEALLYGGDGAAVDTTLWQYLPSVNRWSPVPTTGHGPAPQDVGSAIWDGREMIVLADPGSRPAGTVWWYTPRTRRWSSVGAQGLAPVSFHDSNAVWTGKQVLLSTEAGSTFAYNPTARTWRLLSTSPAMQLRGNAAAWDGAALLSIGGTDPAATVQNAIWVGAPSGAGGWTWSTANSDGPSFMARSGAVCAWDGHEVLIFGGAGENALLNDLWSLRPNASLLTVPPSSGTASARRQGLK